MDRSEWMAEVCRHAAMTMEAHGLGNRTNQLRNVADQLAAAPPPPAEQASGDDLAEQFRRGWEAGRAATLSQRPVVSDEMAEIACEAYYADFRGAYEWGPSNVAAMKSAMVLALAPQQPEKGEVP